MITLMTLLKPQMGRKNKKQMKETSSEYLLSVIRTYSFIPNNPIAHIMLHNLIFPSLSEGKRSHL